MDSALPLSTVARSRPKATARPITRIDRTAVRRLGLSLATLLVAYVAQGLLAGSLYVADAGLVLLLAALLFSRSAAGTLRPIQPETAPALPAFSLRGELHPGLTTIGVALVANLAGLGLVLRYWLFDPAARNTGIGILMPLPAWVLYLLSMVVAIVGVYLFDARPSLRQALRRERFVTVALGAAFVVALTLRTYRLGDLPFGMWYDEAFNGLEVQKILSDPNYRPLVGGGPTQGLPAMFWYFMVPLFKIIGPTQLALRLPIALASCFGVIAVFLLGRALFGRALGLVAAGLLATLSWSVTFGRISLNGTFSTTLDAFALACLALGLKTGRRTFFGLGGLALGLGQNFYFASRLFVVVVLVYLGHHLLVGRLPWLRQHAVGLGLFAAFAFVAASPITAAAVVFPRELNERTATVSIFKAVDEQKSYAPLIENVKKHLLMFNVRGDGNGRHNLPGAPMLERTTAALAVLGFFVALFRLRRPEYAALIVWWAVMLQGGIFSLDFEAPQAYRTIDEVIPVALLAALPIVSIGQRIGALAGHANARVAGRTVPTGALVASVFATAMVVWVGAGNVHRYFVEQARNASVWAAHAVPERLIAQEINRRRTVGQVYLDAILMDEPPIKFLAPQYNPHRRYDPARTLPIRDVEGATIFLHFEQAAELSTIKRVYPDAIVRDFRNPYGGPAVLYEAIIPPDQADRVQGSVARFWPGTAASGDPTTQVSNGPIELSAGSLPLPTPFVAEWRAVLAAPKFGRYAFKLDGPADASLSIDETELTSGGVEAGVTLARGNHTLLVRAPIATPSDVRLLWREPGATEYATVPREDLFSAPVTNNGLLGSYYRGPSWAGEPALQQIDPSLQIRIHLLPLERPYSVEWRGKLYVPSAGNYRLGTASRDGSWIFVDERMVVDNGAGAGGYVEGVANLTQGFHDVRIRFLDQTGHTFINAFWTPPGKAREPIPSAYLFPPQGAYPDKVLPPLPAPNPSAPPVEASGSQAVGVGQGAPGQAGTKPGTARASAPVATQPGVPASTPRVTLDPQLAFGEPGAGPGQLNQPRGVAIGKDGSFYVADTGNHRVVKFGADGKFVATWGTAADLIEPLAVAIDSAGRIVVLDSEPGWIKRYTSEGQLVDQIAGPEARFYHPRGMAIDAADNIYVADTGGGRVVKFNGKGEQIAMIGTKGKGPGQIAEPVSVVADAGGIWVTDSANSKMVRYSSGGQADIELPIARSGSVNGPHGVPTPDGGVLLADPESGRLVLFGPDGLARTVFDVGGLKRPIGLAVGAGGTLAIGDVERQQVLVIPGVAGLGG